MREIDPLKPGYFVNILLWLDQGINVVFLYGAVDETISARAYRNAQHYRQTGNHSKRKWETAERAINRLFFWQKDSHGNKNHCYRSWRAEVERKQYPREYQNGIS